MGVKEGPAWYGKDVVLGMSVTTSTWPKCAMLHAWTEVTGLADAATSMSLVFICSCSVEIDMSLLSVLLAFAGLVG